jgi:hypothetical protein
MAKDTDPPTGPDAWEVVDFRSEPSGAGLVAVYMEADGVTSTWVSVVGWLGFAAKGDVSPVRRWGAGVLYEDFPEVAPAWEVDDGRVYVGIYDSTGGQTFDEWLTRRLEQLPHPEPVD